MILNDIEIIKRVEEGDLNIDPFERNNVEPSSLDIRVSNDFVEFPRNKIVDPPSENEDLGEEIKIKDEDFYILEPKQYVLGTTVENFEIPDDLVAVVHGRSSWGRLGLVPHIEAGYIDPGFKGEITLEIANLSENKIKIPINSRIGQIVFHRMSSDCEEAYNGKYQSQEGASQTKISRDYL